MSSLNTTSTIFDTSNYKTITTIGTRGAKNHSKKRTITLLSSPTSFSYLLSNSQSKKLAQKPDLSRSGYEPSFNEMTKELNRIDMKRSLSRSKIFTDNSSLLNKSTIITNVNTKNNQRDIAKNLRNLRRELLKSPFSKKICLNPPVAYFENGNNKLLYEMTKHKNSTMDVINACSTVQKKVIKSKSFIGKKNDNTFNFYNPPGRGYTRFGNFKENRFSRNNLEDEFKGFVTGFKTTKKASLFELLKSKKI